MIERDLLIQSYGVIEPLRITYATNEQTIRFWLKDYTLTNNHSAKVYNLTPDGHHYQQNATIDLTQNTITFTPDAGFFSVGENEMQLAISTSAYSTYSFIIPVTCEKNIMADNDPEEATEAMAIVAQAQAAAEVYETATLAVRDNLTVIQNAPTYAQTCQSAVDTVNGYGARITTLENVNASSRLTTLETAKGTTDISSISDGTLTGAISKLKTTKMNNNDLHWFPENVDSGIPNHKFSANLYKRGHMVDFALLSVSATSVATGWFDIGNFGTTYAPVNNITEPLVNGFNGQMCGMWTMNVSGFARCYISSEQTNFMLAIHGSWLCPTSS